MTKQYDVVLFGATGFTGALTAEYLAAHGPADLRWALAGRNRSKLESLRSRIEASPDLLHADVSDRASLDALAASAKAVISTVGPYLEFGEPLVAACAEAGTDYVDLTGEPEFIDRMYVAYHAKAAASGARIVHSCGFDSVPHDLGVQAAVEQLPEGVPIHVDGLVSASLRPSTGTLKTLFTIASRPKEAVEARRARRRVEPPSSRSVRMNGGRPGRIEGSWVFPMPSVDPQIVVMSAARLDRYGPKFSYTHYFATRSLATLAALGIGGTLVLTAAQISPLRRTIMKRLKDGDGPDAERRARSWFVGRYVGVGGGQRVVTEVSGGDPGYGETAKILGESALCLAFDDLPKTSGHLTPAVAMGPALRDRLVKAGITFRTIEA
jgi:short subunit dehydrogenase-like uncharacterized protein